MIALDIQKSPFTRIDFKETINWKLLIKMLYSKDILQTTTIKRFGKTFHYENERKQIIEILKKGIKHNEIRKKLDDENELNKYLPIFYHHTEKYLNPKINVNYFYDKNKEIGRVYPERSLSLCCLRRPIRHVLSNGLYIDIDMKNAHYKIADEIFNKEEFKYRIIHDYVLNRTKYLKLLADSFNVEGFCNLLNPDNDDDYDALKEYYLRKLYYGTDIGWINDFQLPNAPMPEITKGLTNELDEIANIIKTCNPSWLELNNKSDNINGTIVSWFLQEYERRILEKMYDFFKSKKYILGNDCVLCYDGIMIPLNKKLENKSEIDKLLRDAEKYIFKNIGINVELTTKPFDMLEYNETLQNINIEHVDDPIILIDDKNDAQAISILMDKFIKDDLIYCHGKFYLKTGYFWTVEKQLIESNLLQIVLNSGIKTTTAKGDLKCYAQHMPVAKNLVKGLLSYVSLNPQDDIYQKFHTTNIGKLCFLDGVLFVESKTWKYWNDPFFEYEENKVYTTIVIQREFGQYFEAFYRTPGGDRQTIEDIKNKLFEIVFGEQTEKMLNYLSRAIFGFYTDKDWGLWVGSRNSSKGCVDTLLRASFEKYITSLPSNVFISKKSLTNDTKEMSWLLDLEYVRLAIVQEIDRKDKSVTINGTTIKSVNSGGDSQKTRRNYGEIQEFSTSAKIMFFVNDLPDINPIDTLQTCVQFTSHIQFKSEDFINNKRIELEEKTKDILNEKEKKSIMTELDIYKIADDTIKFKCMSREWADAFVMLLVEYFINKKVEPMNESEMIEEENENGKSTNLDNLINQKFIFTNNYDDKISLKRIDEIRWSCCGEVSKVAFNKQLIGRGAKKYVSNSIRGLRFITEKTVNENENDCP